MNSRKIILASASQQRRELLVQMGLDFIIVPSTYKEWLDETQDAHDVASQLGLGKARAVADQHPEALVIGSDTIICFQGRQLGKQPSEAAARAFLHELRGRAITVITSVALVCRQLGVERVATDEAKIVFEPYADDAIDTYLREDNWQDKAGGVAIQTPHSVPVAYVRGAYDTVHLAWRPALWPRYYWSKVLKLRR
jgi:septum formation protein